MPPFYLTNFLLTSFDFCVRIPSTPPRYFFTVSGRGSHIDGLPSGLYFLGGENFLKFLKVNT